MEGGSVHEGPPCRPAHRHHHKAEAMLVQAAEGPRPHCGMVQVAVPRSCMGRK
jgi:hypothetical protein